MIMQLTLNGLPVSVYSRWDRLLRLSHTQQSIASLCQFTLSLYSSVFFSQTLCYADSATDFQTVVTFFILVRLRRVAVHLKAMDLKRTKMRLKNENLELAAFGNYFPDRNEVPKPELFTALKISSKHIIFGTYLAA